MNRNWTRVGMGLALVFATTAYAAEHNQPDQIAAAEKGCKEQAQERYGATADNVTVRGKTKWRSGLKGYRVQLTVTGSNGKTAKYVCSAQEDGEFVFYKD